jgi:hypothetical protein
MKSEACRWALAIATAAFLIACDQDGGTTTDASVDTPTEPAADAEPDAVDDPVDEPVPDSSETYSVSGTVAREASSTCPPLSDGVGPLCVHILGTCGDMSSEVASLTIPSADMSWPTNTVEFTVTDVPDGSHQIFAYHDDDASGCDGTLTSGDFFLGDMCVPVTVDGADVTGISITFNNKQP